MLLADSVPVGIATDVPPFKLPVSWVMPLTKPLPLTVMLGEGVLSVMVDGVMELILGRGVVLIVKVSMAAMLVRRYIVDSGSIVRVFRNWYDPEPWYHEGI